MTKILVVEDEATIREFINITLTAEGHQVVTANDGAVAFTLATQGNFDLILLDLHLPKMDGTEFLEAYSEQEFTRAPIIILTATNERFLPLSHPQVKGHLEKPFNLSQLIDLANRFSNDNLSETIKKDS